MLFEYLTRHDHNADTHSGTHMLTTNDLIHVLTDRTLDCSKYPVVARSDYEVRIAQLHAHKNNLLLILRSNYWDYVSELVSKLPRVYTLQRFLIIACKNIAKSPDVRAATMVYHYLSELAAVITHTIITENNVDNTIGYICTDYDMPAAKTAPTASDTRAIDLFMATL